MAETIDELSNQLAAHERIMQDRYEHLEKGMEEIKRAEGAEGVGMNLLGTAGLGLMGNGDGSTANGLILGALLGNGGLLGNRNRNDGEGCVTPTQLSSGLNGVTEANNVSAILQTLGDIKASVPLAEGQVQLALAGAQADLNRNIDGTGDQLSSQINAGQISNLQGQAALSQQLANVIATSLASQSTIKDTVQDTAAATNLAIANLATAGIQNTYALNTAIRDANDKAIAATTAQGLETRALINSLNTHNLERSLSDANNKINMLEIAAQNGNTQRQLRETEININNSNTATATAMQAQTMQQQQFQLIAQLTAAVGNLANDIQSVKQGSVVFNSGRMMDSGNQSAANTRVSG